MSNILVTGAKGQLGTEICKLLDEKNIDYLGVGSKELNITDSSAVKIFFEQYKPSFVIHCAAYTAVDAAEDEGKVVNWNVNALGTENIANASQSVNATLVYISTDYVFDGENKEEYLEEDEVNPKNEYGKAKLAGERAVQELCEKYYIVRTSWVFGKFGKNFVYTMRKLAKSYDELTVVYDQIGRPTWTRTIAEFLLHVYKTKPDHGIYHISNDGYCSWYEFASEILKDEDIKIMKISSEEYPQKAFRPRNSILSLDKVKATGFEIITWKSALELFNNHIN